MQSAVPIIQRSALTLIEMLVVLAILAGMLSLLVPAVQKARESGRRMTCQNNARQLTLAMRGYVEAHKRVPDRAAPGKIGGWSLAILPFMEEGNLASGLEQNPSLAPGSVTELARMRPATMTCPSAGDEPSAVPEIPVSHYVLQAHPSRESWRIGDAPLDVRSPWAVGPEIEFAQWGTKTGPHDGGFNIADTEGAVELRVPVGVAAER